MVDMKLGTSLGRANLVKHLVVVAAIGDSLAVVRSLCGVEVKHAVDVHCTHSLFVEIVEDLRG